MRAGELRNVAHDQTGPKCRRRLVDTCRPSPQVIRNMARLLAAVALLAPATGFVAPAAPASSSALRADASGMDGIQAPTGFFDPLGLSKSASDETLAWYRAAEIKHGRVAMAAFLGCVVNGLGLEFPGAIDVNGDTFASMGSTKLPL